MRPSRPWRSTSAERYAAARLLLSHPSGVRCIAPPRRPDPMALHGIEGTERRSVSDAPMRSGLDGRQAEQSRDGFFARRRARWLRQCLDELGERPATMVMLGWDRGSTTSEFFANLHLRS